MIAITPKGTTVYVANYGSGTVTPITGNKPGTPIAVGTHPMAIVITSTGTTAYVSNCGSGSVTSIPVGGGKTSVIKVGNGPDAFALAPNGKTVYVTNYNSASVSPITVGSTVAGKPITVGINPGAIVIAP